MKVFIALLAACARALGAACSITPSAKPFYAKCLEYRQAERSGAGEFSAPVMECVRRAPA